MKNHVTFSGSRHIRIMDGWPAALGGALMLLIVSAWLFHLQAVPPATGNFATDLKEHLRFAQQFWEGNRYIPHPGFHVTTLLLSNVSGFTPETSAVIILTAATVASYLITLLILKYYLQEKRDGVSLALLAFALSLVSAVYVPLFSQNIYLGQGTPNIWHNPTWITTQPFALLSFYLAERWCQVEDRKTPFRLALLVSLLLAITTVFKPSFALAFVPAFGLFALSRLLLKKQPVRDLSIVSGMVAPTLVIMALQYVGNYGQATSTGGESIIWWAPFAVWSQKTPSVSISIFLTLAFPLSVLMTHWRRLSSRPGFCLAWILMLVAFLQRALFAESGTSMMAGNWSWGYMFALKIAFIYSVIALFSSKKQPLDSRILSWWLPMIILAVHFGSGLIYIGRLLAGVGYY